jgi:purine-cytosine permease-like protein
MRWKLLLIASLSAAIVGAGGTLSVALGLLGSTDPIFKPDLVILLTFLVPVAAITLASIFVYRHTARRRKLQAMTTALLAIILTLTILLLSPAFFSRPQKEPTPPPRNIG